MGPETTATSQGVRAKLATLLFLIALLLGNGALIGGLDAEGGILAAGFFAVACVLWWVSYRISRSANGKGMTLGIVALGLSILGVAGALAAAFHHYIGDHFFWASAAILAVLIAAIAIREASSDVRKIPPTPG
jgi:hypothetical protein